MAVDPNYRPEDDGRPLILGVIASMAQMHAPELHDRMFKHFEVLHPPNYSEQTGQVESFDIKMATGTYRVWCERVGPGAEGTSEVKLDA